jgi:hypothetical protein
MLSPYALLTSRFGSLQCALATFKGLEESLIAASIDLKRALFGLVARNLCNMDKGHPSADLSIILFPD